MNAAPGPAVSLPQVLAWRLRRHLLTAPGSLTAAQVADRLVGVQTQVPSAAEPAVAEGALIRTWAQRGTCTRCRAPRPPATWALLAAARSWRRASRHREFAPGPVMDLLAELVPLALAGGPLTRTNSSRRCATIPTTRGSPSSWRPVGASC